VAQHDLGLADLDLVQLEALSIAATDLNGRFVEVTMFL
jgi:hypothetical protein